MRSSSHVARRARDRAARAPHGWVAAAKAQGAKGGGAASAFRALRLVRVFKLAREWHAMRAILAKTHRTLASCAPFSALLALFVFISATLGQQLFANRMRYDDAGWRLRVATAAWDDAAGSTPRLHFDELPRAMLTVFVALTGEGWNASCTTAGARPGASRVRSTGSSCW